MQYGFFFDARRCTGCKTCVLACKDYRDLPAGIAFRQVYEYVGGSWDKGGDGLWRSDAYAYFVSSACNHCARPVCVQVCPTGAMHKDERTGLVSVDERRCIGCGYCALACPYRAPKVDRELGHSVKCDGCADRVAAGLAPVCVEACPLRALEFGDIGELRAEHGDACDLEPLPPSTATSPSLVVRPPRRVPGDGSGATPRGSVANVREIV